MNKTMVIGAAIVLLVIVVAGAYFLTSSKSAAKYTTTASITSVSTTQQYITASTTKSTATTTVQATTTVKVNSSSYTINLESSSANGNYLANATGFTLYTSGSDSPNSGASSCYSACATNWPPFYTASLVLPQGLNASSFGTITRTGGAKQTTYKGYPLYFFAGDHSSGEVNGNGLGGFKVATK